MDNLTYQYLANKNQLGHVDDSVAAGNYTTDVDDQQSGNYTYDAIGNLITDAAEGITNIDWTVYGKIASISKSNGNAIQYTYDAAGNRITKTTYVNGNLNITTVYVRDASGNVMAVYETESSAPAEQREVHLYGSSRLGMVNNLHTRPDTTLTLANGFGKGILSTFTRGAKVFELSNHLGNVLATVSDKRMQHTSDGTTIAYYTAEVISATDYYPFGMTMPGRNFSSNLYRYGFNGKENDNEVKGEGNSIAYENRIYDTRLGRWLSLDPFQRKYSGESNYIYTSNNPILYLDTDGRDKVITHVYTDEKGKILRTFKVTIAGDIKSQAIKVRNTIDKSDWHWEYQWHDINQSVTHVMKNGTEVSKSVSGETLGKVRTKTDFNWEWWAQQKIALKDNQWSGIEFYSEGGQGMESKKTPFAVDRVNIGKLLTLIDGMKDVGQIEILQNTFTKYAINSETAKTMEIIMNQYERVTQGIDAVEKIEQSGVINSKDSEYDAYSNLCIGCKSKLPSGTLGHNDLDVLRTDRDGKVKDTLRKNDKTGKVDTLPNRKKN